MTKSPLNQWAKVKIASWLSNLASNPAESLFLLFLIFLPSQLGRHFWPSFAFINGLRVDYLSPILYLSDVILFLIVLDLLPLLLRRLPKRGMLLVSIPVIILGVLARSSFSPDNSLFGFLRLIEVILVSIITTWFLSQQSIKKKADLALSLAVIYTGVLTVWQFIIQSSVGGLWYWLGERTFTNVTPGIANARLAGELILRPYASFPHPNVLAGFLTIIICYLLFFVFPTKKSRLQLAFLVLAIPLGILALSLTLSRTAVIVFLLIVGVWLIRYLFHSRLNQVLSLLIFVLLSILFVKTGFVSRFASFSFNDEAILIREFLIGQAFSLFLQHPFFGVGLQNFLPSLASQLPPLTPINYFQPVHSFYLLLLSETGLVGLVLFLFLLLLSAKRIIYSPAQEQLGKFMLLMTILLLGTTDHYLYSLQQGRLVLAFVFGVVWVKGLIDASVKEGLSLRKAKNLRTGAESERAGKSLSSQSMKNSRKGKPRS